VFRLLDSLSDRNIVQVFNKDESHIYATILAIPNFRLRATDKTVITFAERAADEPPAVKAWFYPGDNWGQEFVYPKSKALELAKRTNLPVLYIPDEVAPSIVAPVKTADDAPVAALKEAPLKAVSPAGQDVALADVVTSPAPRLRMATATSSSPGIATLSSARWNAWFPETAFRSTQPPGAMSTSSNRPKSSSLAKRE
jgi:hypothetical protein